MPYTVYLSYFRESGKWYSDGEYQTEKEYLFEIWEEIKEMRERGECPGLVGCESNWYTLVNVPRHPHRHPHLIGAQTLTNLIDTLDNDIPGIRDAYAANSAEGLVKFILAWAWEDAERVVREEAKQ
jgi:hypothetical protein